MEKEQPAPVEQTEHQTTGEKQAENVVPSKIVDPQSKVSKEEKELPKAPAKTENLTEKMVVESQTLKNPDLVLQLIDMGFNETLAKRAVEQTDSLEEAVNLIIIMEENDGGHISAPTKDQVKQLHYKMVDFVHPGDSRSNRYQDDCWQDGCPGRPRRSRSLQSCLAKQSTGCRNVGMHRPDESRR